VHVRMCVCALFMCVRVGTCVLFLKGSVCRDFWDNTGGVICLVLIPYTPLNPSRADKMVGSATSSNTSSCLQSRSNTAARGRVGEGGLKLKSIFHQALRHQLCFCRKPATAANTCAHQLCVYVRSSFYVVHLFTCVCRFWFRALVSWLKKHGGIWALEAHPECKFARLVEHSRHATAIFTHIDAHTRKHPTHARTHIPFVKRYS